MDRFQPAKAPLSVPHDLLGKKRLLFLIRDLGCGGAQRQIIELVKNIDKEHFSVTVATYYDGGGLRAEMEGVPCVRLLSLHKQGRWDIVPFLSRFIRLVREVRPHITHGYMEVANELCLLARLSAGGRVVWGIRDSKSDGLLDHSGMQRLIHHLGSWLSRFADCIIVNSEAGRDNYRRAGYKGERMVVIQNGIDTERFQPDPAAGRRLRKEWGIERDAPLIGVVGRIDPMKDHRTFLYAAASLVRRRPTVRFVCIGNANEGYGQQLRALSADLGLADRVLWSPARPDISAVYNALDILTSSSCSSEGFSNVVGEAMACGTVVVVTDVGDSAQIVNSADRVIPKENPGALAAAWENLLQLDLDAKAAIGRASRDRIIKEYSLVRLTKRTEAALLETL